jgi:hypothetical protein
MTDTDAGTGKETGPWTHVSAPKLRAKTKKNPQRDEAEGAVSHQTDTGSMSCGVRGYYLRFGPERK